MNLDHVEPASTGNLEFRPDLEEVGWFWPAEQLLVLLSGPFRAQPVSLPPGVELRAINDPHWWKSEYFHAPTGHCLACRF